MDRGDGQLFEVVIEVPRWGFVKRGSNDKVDFVSPLPCPYNYGSIPAYVGLDGDLLDAVVLGPRLPRGTMLNLRVYGVIGLTDRGMYDDKLICSEKPLTELDRFLVLNFFRFYAVFKRLLNFVRCREGRSVCEGWRDVDGAIARARPRDDSCWEGQTVVF
jgi:inorganic pyrophosphatase